MSDDGLKEFMNQQLINYKKSAEVLNTDSGTIDVTTEDGKDKTDYNKADNNELLKEDYIEIT